MLENLEHGARIVGILLSITISDFESNPAKSKIEVI